MVLDKNMIKQLVTVFNYDSFNEQHNITIDNVTYKLDFNKEKDKLVLTITKDENNDLKEFINSLDDDTFQTACEEVEPLTGRTLGDWNENSTQEEILEMFKAVVKVSLRKQKEFLKAKLDKITNIYANILKGEE